METVAQTLKQAREEKGLSINDVAAATKMTVQTVHDIEDDKLSASYASIYAKGFLKLYAEAVGLDPQEIIDRHISRQKSRSAPPVPDSRKEPPGPPPIDWKKTMESITSELQTFVTKLKPRSNEKAPPPARGSAGPGMINRLTMSFKAIPPHVWKTAAGTAIVLAVAVFAISLCQRCASSRLLSRSLEYQVIQEPPPPYIE